MTNRESLEKELCRLTDKQLAQLVRSTIDERLDHITLAIMFRNWLLT
jgi:hypothetical protein